MDRKAALAALTAPGGRYELDAVELFGHTCRAFRHAPPTLRNYPEWMIAFSAITSISAVALRALAPV